MSINNPEEYLQAIYAINGLTCNCPAYHESKINEVVAVILKIYDETDDSQMLAIRSFHGPIEFYLHYWRQFKHSTRCPHDYDKFEKWLSNIYGSVRYEY